MMFWAGIALFSVGAMMQAVAHGFASPWFWAPLIPAGLLIAWRYGTNR